MAKSDQRGRSRRNKDSGVMEMARERPVAAAAAAAGAAAAGLFLWSKRAQISDQLNHLTEQVGEWKDSMRSNGGFEASETAKNQRSAELSRTGAGNAGGSARSGRSSASSRGRARAIPSTT